MPGLRDVMTLIPPVLLSQWTITSPTQSLHDVRVLGSTDPTYGTVGALGQPNWLPPEDGSPWAVLGLQGTHETTPEPGRVRAVADIVVWLAIEDAETPAVLEDYHDRWIAWQDSFRQIVAANRRLAPGSVTLYPTAGDVRWEYVGGKQQPALKLFGGEWYGAELHTQLSLSMSVNYQG